MIDRDLLERVARGIASGQDLDPEVFIGFHGRRAWENVFYPQAEGALEASGHAELCEALEALLHELEGDGFHYSPAAESKVVAALKLARGGQ